MENTTVFVLVLVVICTYIGIWIGRGIEAARWCYYASRYNKNPRERMNSGGKLYEVKEVR